MCKAAQNQPPVPTVPTSVVRAVTSRCACHILCVTPVSLLPAPGRVQKGKAQPADATKDELDRVTGAAAALDLKAASE